MANCQKMKLLLDSMHKLRSKETTLNAGEKTTDEIPAYIEDYIKNTFLKS